MSLQPPSSPGSYPRPDSASSTTTPTLPSPTDSEPKPYIDSMDMKLLRHMMTLMSNSASALEKTMILADNPKLIPAIIEKRPDIADSLARQLGMPLTDLATLKSKSKRNLPESPMEISVSSENNDNAMQTDTSNSNVNATKRNSSSDNSDFVLPPARLTVKKVKDSNSAPSVPTNNMFTNLPEEILTTDSVSPPTPAPTTSKRTPRIRPIHFSKTDKYLDLIQTIANTVDKSFTYTTSSKFVKIFPNSVYAHTKIVEFLKNSKSEGFFSPIPDYVPIKAVIRGLDIDSDLNDIQNSLTDAGFKPLKVAQLTSRKNGPVKKLPLFQIHLLDTEHNKTIFSLISLNYRKVKIEKYRNTRQVIQCYNCQNFNHQQSECYLPPRCIRCAKNHKSHECPNVTEKLPQPTCCNCGLQHPANYRGCVNFPKPRPLPTPKPTNTRNFSYAQAAQATPPNASAPPTAPSNSLPIGPHSDSPLFAIASVITEIETALNVKSLFALLKNLKSLLTEIKSSSSQENRFFLIVQRLPTLFSFDP